MKNIELLYGSKAIDLKLDNDFDVIKIIDSVKETSKEIFKNKLLSFFNELEYDLADIAIVIADKTRACDYKIYLPVLVDTLESLGAKSEAITFYIAYGTHPPQLDSESLTVYGDIFDKYKFIHHDCSNKDDFEFFGKTSQETEIAYRKDVLKSTFKITFGALSHHYFAGFGGGRKLIFPGLGYKNSIYSNHSLFLDKENKMLEANCQPGILKNNPLADDLKEVTSKMKIDLSIHGILDSHSKVLDLILGNCYTDFEKACELHSKTTAFKVDKLYDIVIASCGGFPKDINFIQTHKSVHYAAMFLKDGGELYLLAECRDQIGSKTFLPWFEYDSFEETFDNLKDNYSGNGGTALALMTKAKRISIKLITDLSDNICKKIGIMKLQKSDLNNINTNNKNILVIPNASMSVKNGSSPELLG
jgi:lactate racemase